MVFMVFTYLRPLSPPRVDGSCRYVVLQDVSGLEKAKKLQGEKIGSRWVDVVPCTKADIYRYLDMHPASVCCCGACRSLLFWFCFIP